VLRAGIALAFALFGLEKFPSGADAHWVRFFDQVGVGQWFRYFTGILATTMAVASAIHISVIRQPANEIITGGRCLGLAAFWWSRRS
jgi:hypothetical protein